MNRWFVPALAAVGLAAAVPAADQSDASRGLLEQLRLQRQSILKNPSCAPSKRPRTDLEPMAGLDRQTLLDSLGVPDFCSLPVGDGCGKSSHWAYFFYRVEPFSAKAVAGGVVEITVTAGGGWALEIDLAHDSVAKAAWVKQE